MNPWGTQLIVVQIYALSRALLEPVVFIHNSTPELV